MSEGLESAFPGFRDHFDQCLTRWCVEGEVIAKGPASLLEHVRVLPYQTLPEQFQVLSSVSNFYQWKYPLPKGGVFQSSPRLLQYLLWHPDMGDFDGFSSPMKFPSSPRNQLIFFLLNDRKHGSRFSLVVEKALREDDSQHTLSDFQDEPPPPDRPPPPKRRRYVSRIVSATAEQVAQNLEVTLVDVDNCAPKERFLFDQFAERLSDGVIQWRQSSEEVEVVCMNDFCPTSGRFLPCHFVTLTVSKLLEGKKAFHCTCKVHNLLTGVELGGVEEEMVLLDDKWTCMHARFFCEFLANVPNDLENESLSHVLDNVKRHFPEKDNPLVLLGAASMSGASKFSVKGTDSTFSLVHITFRNGCNAMCMNGFCRASIQNKKKIPKVLPMSKADLCPHLSTVYANVEFVKSFFPEFFGSMEEDAGNEGESGAIPQPMGEEVNQEDAQIGGIPDSVSFHEESGLWKSLAFSQTTPFEMHDPDLVRATGSRLQFINPCNMTVRGQYEGPDLKPDCNGKNCMCGVGFF